MWYCAHGVSSFACEGQDSYSVHEYVYLVKAMDEKAA